jgi:hypothetical protein
MPARVATASTLRGGVVGAEKGSGECSEPLLVFGRSQVGRSGPARYAVPPAALGVERCDSSVMELVGVHASLCLRSLLEIFGTPRMWRFYVLFANLTQPQPFALQTVHPCRPSCSCATRSWPHRQTSSARGLGSFISVTHHRHAAGTGQAHELLVAWRREADCPGLEVGAAERAPTCNSIGHSSGLAHGGRFATPSSRAGFTGQDRDTASTRSPERRREPGERRRMAEVEGRHGG